MSHWEDIMDYVEAHPGATTPEIAEAVGLVVGKVFNYARKLEPYGIIRHETSYSSHPQGRITRWWSRRTE